jgi:hypothetical protein
MEPGVIGETTTIGKHVSKKKKKKKKKVTLEERCKSKKLLGKKRVTYCGEIHVIIYHANATILGGGIIRITVLWSWKHVYHKVYYSFVMQIK